MAAQPKAPSSMLAGANVNIAGVAVATDENDQVNNKEAAPKEPSQDSPPSEPSEPAAQTKEESKGSRMSAAKAFYRQLYAGNEVSPEQFGMELGPPPKSADNFASAPVSGPCPNCTRMESQARDFEQKANEAEGFYKRIAADFENYRKRVEREKEEYSIQGVQRALEALLPALDDLDRAQASLSASSDPKALLDAFKMVAQRFQKCLEGVGIKVIDVIGQPFDPRLHEPVQEVKTTEVPDGHVAHELRRGYQFKEKILRPSLVNVASHDGAPPKGKDAPQSDVGTATADVAPITADIQGVPSQGLTTDTPDTPQPEPKAKSDSGSQEKSESKSESKKAEKPESKAEPNSEKSGTKSDKSKSKDEDSSVIEIDEGNLGEEKSEEELLKSLEKTASGNASES